MEGFNLGANLLSVVQAKTVSSDGQLFGGSFPKLIIGENKLHGAISEKEFSLPDESVSMFPARDIMKSSPSLPVGEVEHSFLSGADFRGNAMSPSFPAPLDSPGIHSLQRLVYGDPPSTPSLGTNRPKNVSVLACSGSKENPSDQDSSIDSFLGFGDITNAASSPQMGTAPSQSVTDLESFLSPITDVREIPSSATVSDLSSPHAMAMDALLLSAQCSSSSMRVPEGWEAPGSQVPADVLSTVTLPTRLKDLPHTETTQEVRRTSDATPSVQFARITKPRAPKLKMHACGVCGISFAAKCNLFKHQRAVHLGLKPYSCTQCPSSFSERNKLQKHILTVHRLERNHKCDLCDTRFGQKSDLRRHVQVVHEQQKNFGCETCGRAFGRRSSLSQHMKRVHSRHLPSLREDGRTVAERAAAGAAAERAAAGAAAERAAAGAAAECAAAGVWVSSDGFEPAGLADAQQQQQHQLYHPKLVAKMSWGGGPGPGAQGPVAATAVPLGDQSATPSYYGAPSFE